MDRIRVFNKPQLKDRRRDLRIRQTSTETILWNELRNKKLGYKFKRQYSISGYVVDFYCAQSKLAIEVLGSIHKTDSAKKYDDYRRRYLQSCGVRMIEFWNWEIEGQLEKVLAKISQIVPLLDKERAG